MYKVQLLFGKSLFLLTTIALSATVVDVDELWIANHEAAEDGAGWVSRWTCDGM